MAGRPPKAGHVRDTFLVAIESARNLVEAVSGLAAIHPNVAGTDRCHFGGGRSHRAETQTTFFCFFSAPATSKRSRAWSYEPRPSHN